MSENLNPDITYKGNKEEWYKISKGFWENQDKTDSGMLDGYIQVSGSDIYESRDLIEKYQKKKKLGNTKAADCGSGIGRVSYLCLMDYFKHIDLIDPVASFLDVAEQKFDGFPCRKYPVGIQDWIPEDNYDVFWCQWSIMYLTDEDCIKFLQRCKQHLLPNGLIIIKDNICDRDVKAGLETFEVDTNDNSLLRSYKVYLNLFVKAGLHLVEAVKQTNYPKYLLPLYTFVLN
ncbi:adrenal gland protein, putative [Trichomonas vaginalis G3]|uniref:Alpha N-terminal protein methyltransferase 1 n=1 Tax=Trichomonas vaginalis (strain ATCC PRA-98 / G3) TaxID=412133 RepID=A2DJV9_TRIV3|nr:O-methyltransferase protein [Trichomonas vaginalis G3]EAY19323.1 adrenal gland protein, putative [Trichomonas vaginalis G3]KAI5527223.1 O-methyltransferase protein [Trichomonas vaginalis G3]|eukprot:XP_001580309.1 adrenal gland protein [Trichomonas vaginalis G3]